MRRYISIVIIVLFSLFIGIFTFQNLEHVTLRLFSGIMVVPASALVFFVYFLGMVTGGLALDVLRKAIADARKKGSAAGQPEN